MNDQQLFKLVSNELFKNGSCTPNVWQLIKIVDGEKVALFEAMLPNRGNIRIRKPFKKSFVNSDGEQVYYYEVFKFTKKMKLKDDGIMEDTKPVETKEAV
jgi:hypothetical protein